MKIMKKLFNANMITLMGTRSPLTLKRPDSPVVELLCRICSQFFANLGNWLAFLGSSEFPDRGTSLFVDA